MKVTPCTAPLALASRPVTSKKRAGGSRHGLTQRRLRRADHGVATRAVEEGSLPDVAVPVLFTVATVALSVVTLGVIYLNVTSWLESRKDSDQKQQKKTKYDKDMKEFMEDAKGSPKEKKSVKRATDKGFGSP